MFGRGMSAKWATLHFLKKLPKLRMNFASSSVGHRCGWPTSTVGDPGVQWTLRGNLVDTRRKSTRCDPAVNTQPIKRSARKRTKPFAVDSDTEHNKDERNVVAYACAEELDLERMATGLHRQGLYQSDGVLPDDVEDTIHVSAKYNVDGEQREVYVFREGAAVFWNVPELERSAVLKFLKNYGDRVYDDELIQDENEMLHYSLVSAPTRLSKGKIFLNCEGSLALEKYTFSNALSLSVKLAMWESALDRFVEGIEDISEDLKRGQPVKLSRDQVLQKMGELFALRHMINLSSDLLDTPDFYWEREQLEPMYHKTCYYLNISKRTKVMNEKLNHCSDLMQLLKDHLNDQHHVRLEVMIIVLITVEVVFEFVHWIV